MRLYEYMSEAFDIHQGSFPDLNTQSIRPTKRSMAAHGWPVANHRAYARQRSGSPLRFGRNCGEHEGLEVSPKNMVCFSFFFMRRTRFFMENADKNILTTRPVNEG